MRAASVMYGDTHPGPFPAEPKRCIIGRGIVPALRKLDRLAVYGPGRGQESSTKPGNRRRRKAMILRRSTVTNYIRGNMLCNSIAERDRQDHLHYTRTDAHVCIFTHRRLCSSIAPAATSRCRSWVVVIGRRVGSAGVCQYYRAVWGL